MAARCRNYSNDLKRQGSLAALARCVVQADEDSPRGKVLPCSRSQPEASSPRSSAPRAKSHKERGDARCNGGKGKCTSRRLTGASVSYSPPAAQPLQSSMACRTSRHGRSMPRLPVPPVLSDIVEDSPTSPSYTENPSSPYSMPNSPHSPSSAELTDTVLLKSEHLLQQLAELSFGPEVKTIRHASQDLQIGAELDVQSAISPLPSPVASLPSKAAGVETVEVPAAFLKMLAEKFGEEMCAPHIPLSYAVLGDGKTEKRSRKNKHFSSASSMTSAASTVTPSASESGSDASSSTNSPIGGAFGPLPEGASSVRLASPSQPSPCGLSSATSMCRTSSPSCTMVGTLRSPRYSMMLPPCSTVNSVASMASMKPSSGYLPCSSAGLPSSHTVSLNLANVPVGSSVSVTVTPPPMPQTIQPVSLPRCETLSSLRTRPMR